jgi:hypothetical protein
MSLASPHRDWFLRDDPTDQHTKTSWCFIGPALRLKPLGKNHCAVRPAPAAAGVSLLVSRFLPTRELSNNRLTLHRTTSAKTRATATLRQRHIPPNVMLKLEN